MSYSMCPYCNQLYLSHSSYICKHADSLPSERSTLNCNFQMPIQGQGNVKEMSSLPKEFHDPSSHIGNVSYELSREASVLQDQSTLDTNPANRSDEPALTLPSFQSTFINNRRREVNQEIPLSPPDHTYQMSNLGENIPFEYGPAPDTFIPDDSQVNSGEANNCRESFDGSYDIQSVILLNEPSELPNEEGLPEDISFAFQSQKEIETRDTNTRVISENSLDKEREIAVPTHSRLKKHVCLDCKKRFNFKSELERHSVVHSGEKPFTCDICKKGFTQKESMRRHKVTHTGIAGSDVAGRSRTPRDDRTCQVCVKEFRDKSALERHSVVHSGLKPFNCDICQKNFTQKGYLKSHKLNHQIIASADNVFAIAGPSRSPSFICDICQKGFSRKDNLKRHKITHTRNPSADNVLVISSPPS